MEGCGGLRFGHGALLRWADDGGGLGRGWRPNPGHPRSVRPGVRLFRPVLGLAPAVVFATLIDYLADPHGQLGYVLLLVAAGVGAALAGGLIGVADSYLITVISEGIVFSLRKQVFENLLDQSVGWFTRSRSGELMSRLSNDIDAVDDVVTDTVFGLARNVFTAAATLVLMLRFTWQLTAVVLVLIPLVSLPARKAGTATYRARTRTQGKLAEMTAYLQE